MCSSFAPDLFEAGEGVQGHCAYATGGELVVAELDSARGQGRQAPIAKIGVTS